MRINKVVEILLKEVGTDHLQFISGEILSPGKKECCLTKGRGSVYGVAMKLSLEEKDEFFNKHNENLTGSSCNWISIGDDYYPLYWGKDINMGARLHSHTKASKSTGTIRLNKRKELRGKTVIFGAVPCSNYTEIEKRLHQNYPCIYKTRKGGCTDELSIKDFIPE